MSVTRPPIGKVNRSFQITVPKKYREAFKIDIGDVIEFDLREDGILVRPLDLLRRRAVKRIEELGKIHVDDELSNLSEDELMRVVNEQIQEVRAEKKKSKTRRRS